ncbi:hypothetical protein C427_3732 [Paraglaciecola psychrophila 170]|uniref:Uncharacterized protein n=1 Tax=Paraglaciecola psychrophila 170 TaxID=1129794 RepID=M4RQA2_9ALTE|nr:hypothetical protein [Paraglaciecola psychrophila]AGH45840.1 hypothetical protein C427_3732 [Paraglaciecola psychrophila 170]
MFINTVPISKTIDFKELSSVIKLRDQVALKQLLNSFNKEITSDGALIKSLDSQEGDYELFIISTRLVLRTITFVNPDHIMPSIDSMLCESDLLDDGSEVTRNHPFKFLQNHILNAGADRIIEFYLSSSKQIPLAITNLYIEHVFKMKFLDFKPLSLSKTEESLVNNTGGNKLLILLLISLQRLEEDDQVLHVYQKEIETQNPKLYRSILSLINPLDDGFQEEEYYSYFIGPCREYLAQMHTESTPTRIQTKEVLEFINHNLQNIHTYGNNPHEFDQNFFTVSVLAVFYNQLDRFKSVFATAIRKLIEAKHLPGIKPRQFPLIKDFYKYFTKQERVWLAKHDYTLCSIEMLYYPQLYKPHELRKMLLNLMCSAGDEEQELSWFNVNEQPEWDEEGLHLINDVFWPMEMAEMLKQVFYPLNNKATVKATYNVISRWIDAFRYDQLDEEWTDAPDPNLIDPLRLATFYSDIIQDVVNHERFGDDKIARRLTNSVYRFLTDKDEYLPTDLLFFVAYFSTDNKFKETAYKQVFERQEDYSSASANNLILIKLDQGDLQEAQAIVDNMEESELRQKCQKLINEKAEKARKLSALIALPKTDLAVSDLSDLHLIFLTATCLSALSVRDDHINHRKKPLSAMLVPDYDTSHKIIRQLLRENILKPKNNSWINIDPENVSKYAITELPLIPNVKGYFQFESFVELLRDELRCRCIAPSVVAKANVKIKMGWLLNSFYHTLEKVSIHWSMWRSLLTITKELKN